MKRTTDQKVGGSNPSGRAKDEGFRPLPSSAFSPPLINNSVCAFLRAIPIASVEVSDQSSE